nr:UDP-glucuronosyltransferase 2B15-like [Leptinotarsa decemlineata]
MNLVLILVFGLLSISSGARILGVFQVPAVSHHSVFRSLWRELSLRGHNVTVVTPFPLNDDSLVNLTEIDVSDPNKEIFERHGFQFFMNKENYVQSKIPKIFALNNEMAEAVLSNKEFIKLYNNSQQQFDVVIAQTYVTPVLYSLSAKFGVPLIGVSSMGGYIGSHFAMGNPHPPSLYSEMFLPYHGQMTLPERVKSTLYYFWARFYRTFIALPKCDAIAKKYLGKDLPYIGDIEKNMSLLLLTTNPFLYTPRPTVPTVISLEQLHIKPVKPLPQDLKEFLDEAKEGVIYFSLGSNVKSVNIPDRVRDTLMEAFSDLPYTVLWKYESDILINKPKNVHIKKWLPQQDLLAHPNIKMFISQGGLQSTEEAVSRGVPILGIPFIADQEMNIKRLAQLGVAVGLDFVTVTKEEILNAVKEIIDNPKYKQNMKKLQTLWVDQPMTSMERAMWWIEYVIRHKGTKHLRSPTVDVSWIEYLLLDVFAVLISALAVFTFLVIAIVKFLVKCCSSKKKSKIH